MDGKVCNRCDRPMEARECGGTLVWICVVCDLNQT